MDGRDSQRARLSISGGSGATTGYATIVGDNPLQLQVIDQGVYKSDPSPYAGRYPCGSLVYNGVWYYGTYCLGPSTASLPHDGITLRLAVAGPVRRLPLLDRLRQDLDADPLHARQAAVRRERLARRAGQDRFAALRRLRQEHGALARRQGLSGRPMERPATDPKPRFANHSWITGD